MTKEEFMKFSLTWTMLTGSIIGAYHDNKIIMSLVDEMNDYLVIVDKEIND